MSLPIELRVRIYEEVAYSTPLTLPNAFGETHGKRSKGTSYTAPGLLLASRVIHQEFLSVMLARALVIIRISNLDFRPLHNILQAQSDESRSALSRNPNLWIYLHAAHAPTPAAADSLKLWCEQQAEPKPTLNSNGSLGSTAIASGRSQMEMESAEEEEEAFGTVAPLLDHPPCHLDFHYHLTFAPTIRAPTSRQTTREVKGKSLPTPALRRACDELAILRAHLRMCARVKQELTTPEGDGHAPSRLAKQRLNNISVKYTHHSPVSVRPGDELRRITGYLAVQADNLERRIQAAEA